MVKRPKAPTTRRRAAAASAQAPAVAAGVESAVPLQLENRVIFASAGTGKTFQLANRYIASLRVSSPERILASTFTRKAAGEIQERVLKHLALAASSPDESLRVASFPGLEGLTQVEAQSLLRNLTHNLHRVRICTLDAFFMNVATSLTLELGLPPGWGLLEELDEAQLRLQAIERLLATDRDEARRLMHLLNAGSTSRSVQSQLVKAVQEFYAIFRQTTPAAWQQVPHLARTTDVEVIEAVGVLSSVTLPADKNWAKAHQASIALSAHATGRSFSKEESPSVFKSRKSSTTASRSNHRSGRLTRRCWLWHGET